MRKKLLSSLLAVTMVTGLLAGCGGSGSGDSGKDTTAPATTEAATQGGGDETPTTESAGEDVTLKWAIWDKDATPYWIALQEAYEESHPNVKIEMVDLGSTDYMTVLATELSGSGSEFDVVTVKDVPGYATLVSKNTLEPLDDYISKAGIDLSQYGGVDSQISVNGSLYELPFRNDFWVIFYNKDIFDAAGVSYPTNDMTWEEYDKLARSVTDTTPGAEIYGSHYHTWRSTIQLDGILDGKHTIVDGDYEFTKPYYEMVLNQQKDGVCMDYATLKTQGLHYSAAFAQGNVATMNMGSWFIATLIQKIKDGEYTDCTNWGIVKYPHADGVEPGSTLSTITALAVPTSAPNKDAAWDFVKFVSGAEGAEVMASTGNIPAMTNDKIVDLIASMDGFPTDEASKEALVTSHTYLEMPANDKSSEIETVLNEQHDLIMNEETSVDDAIAAMNEGVQAILAQ